MLNRLLHIGVVFTLLAGGWGGALASVVCPHAGAPKAAGAEHACCRAKVGGKARRAKERAAKGPQRRAAQAAGHCHAQTPAAPGRKHEEAARHTETEMAGARPAAGHHSAAPTPAGPGEAARVDSAGRRSLSRAASSCAHCVGRSDLPPATARTRDREGPRREASVAAERGPSTPVPTQLSRAPVVAAARGAPPRPTRLHVLHSLFLI